MDRTIREVQDREYEESLNADKEKTVKHDPVFIIIDSEDDDDDLEDPKEGDIVALRLARLKFYSK